MSAPAASAASSASEASTDAPSLLLLGEMQLFIGPQPVRFARRKCAALLAYLALHPGAQPRDRIAQALWPQATADAARGSLRVTLTELRKLLGPEVLEAGDGSSLALRTEALGGLGGGLDLQRLQATIARVDGAPVDELQAAVALYRGELAANLDEPWLEAPRQQLAAGWRRVLHRLVAHHRGAGQYHAAVALARRALQSDPADEAAHQHLMACLWAMGEREAALHQVTLCEQALQQHLGQPPSAETLALAQDLKRQAARAGSARLSNLPQPATRFVGREDELNQIEEQLDRTRLLTLFGPGGSGKTRLAIQAAAEVAYAYDGGVWWVDLSTLDDGQRVVKILAGVLGVQEQGEAPLLALVARHIGSQRMLLVLDNCEQVLQACSRVVEQLLAQAPGLSVLATSRQALGLAAETVWATPTLALPDGPAEALGAELLNNDALRLFAQRAQQADAAFQLGAHNAAQVLDICRRLQGIPLAIELAAAQLARFTVEQLARRLDEALDFEADGRAGERHATLRSAIRWSCRGLGAAEQALFRRLAVFAGGFTLAAAAEVATGAGDAAAAWAPVGGSRAELAALPVDSQTLTAHLLDSLVRQALVQVRRSDHGPRYALLDTLREDARRQSESAGDWPAVQQAHYRHALALAQQVAPLLDGPDQALHVAWLDREGANLEAALDWAERQPTAGAALQLAVPLCPWWKRGVHFSWAVQRLQRLLQRTLEETPVGAAPVALHGQAWFWLADFACRINLHTEASAAAQRSQQIHEALDDAPGQARAAAALSMAAAMGGDFDTAHRAGLRSLALCRELDDLAGLTIATNRMAELTRMQGLLDESVRHNRDSLALAERAGDLRGGNVALLNLGLLAVAQGRPAEGWQMLARSGDGLQALGVRHQWPYVLQGVGQACQALGRTADAVRLYGALEAFSQATGHGLLGSDRVQHQQALDALVGPQAPAALRAAWQAGLALDADAALALLRSLRPDEPAAPSATGV